MHDKFLRLYMSARLGSDRHGSRIEPLRIDLRTELQPAEAYIGFLT